MHLVAPAFNCMEHLWSPLSNRLSGILFPNTVSGDLKPPNQQTIKFGEEELLYDHN